MPDEGFDSDDDMILDLDATVLAPVEPEYSPADIAGLIQYERERCEFAIPCPCGRDIRRGRMCWQCWNDLLTGK